MYGLHTNISILLNRMQGEWTRKGAYKAGPQIGFEIWLSCDPVPLMTYINRQPLGQCSEDGSREAGRQQPR